MFGLAACAFLPVASRADYKTDTGFAKLQAELGASLPTGAGVAVSQIEAGPGAYVPDTAAAEFSGKAFTLKSGASTVSSHANTVASFFYGLSGSMVPGVGTVDLYEANLWAQSGFLNTGTFSAPKSESRAVENHSWIGNFDSGGPNDIEALRRFDFAIQQTGFLGVVALNNGDQGNFPPLLASCYNGISVGLSSGNHSYGTNTTDGSGRTKPEIVAPAGGTSFGTPMVASAAALLRQGATAAAARPVTMKAILMAGATKDPFSSWNRTTARPLDPIFGAGQLNVFNSHHILAAGQQSAGTSATVTRLGWDSTTTVSGSRLYFFDIPAGASTMSLSAILTWNRTITDNIAGPSWGNLTSGLANLTLKLYAASGFTTGALVDTSASAVDNVEHIWQPALAPGRYALEVTSDEVGVTYGLAWQSVPTVSIAATAPMAAEIGPVVGAFTITRGGDTSAALTVNYAISGTATNGTDYVSIPASVTIPAGASSAPVTITPVADSLAEGDETVVIILAPDASYSFGAAFSATVTIQDKPMDAWRFSKFTAAELTDPLLSGDLADFEKDAIVNLHEYAFGLAPKISDTPGLPVVSIQPGGALALAYTRVKSATDITYTVEVSNDLTMWFSGATYTSPISTVDHGATETVKVGSLLAPDAAHCQFMRVRITRP